MELIVKRENRTEKSTIGELLINGAHECFTLEDKDRGLLQSMSAEEIAAKKVFAKTAIPEGRYKVIIDYSDHFGKNLPHILDVPGYGGVRIHSGNTDADTEGCILLGLTKEVDFIGESRVAFNSFFLQLEEAVKTEAVFITIQ